MAKTFGHFTALPVPNDYKGLCATPSGPCTALDPNAELRLTVDGEGNLLMPVDWRGVLADGGNAALPVPRLLRGSSAVRAFLDTPGALAIPGKSFLGSFTPQGRLLPPIFDPQFDGSAIEGTLFGSVDAPYTILRIARRSPSFQQCSNDPMRPCMLDSDCPGGTCDQPTCRGTATPCTDDTDCPGNECGPELFDFGSRLADGIGPIVVPRFATGEGVCEDDPVDVCAVNADCSGANCVDYRLETDIPVPLQGLQGTDDLFAFSVRESIVGADLNGDGDTTDVVFEMRERESGKTLPIGTGGAIGRAVTQLSVPPFVFSAVAAEGDVAAFLEPEPLQGDLDVNGNGRIGETILRVFRRSGGTAVDVLAGQNLEAEAGLMVDRRSLAISDGLVFFRRSEAAAAERVTEVASLGPGDSAGNGHSYFPTMSDDGRYVAFYNDGDNWIGGVSDGLYVRDLVAGTTEASAWTRTRYLVRPRSHPARTPKKRNVSTVGPPFRKTVNTWCSIATRPTWSTVTATAVRTSSSATASPARPSV